MTTEDDIISHHNQSMAANGTGRSEGQKRRLPRLLPPDPVGGSSDETPRTVFSDDSARQRRRTQQKLARQQTPDDRETVSPPPMKDLPLPPRPKQSDERQTDKRRRARRRVKSSSQLQQEPSLLQGFEDEVIIEKSRKLNELILPDLLLASSHADGAASKSAVTPRVYFENKKTFSSVNKDTAALHLNKTGQSPFTLGHDMNYTFQQQTAEVLKRYTVQVARQAHAAFQRFFLFIHGINSGYALWVCIFAYVFTQPDALAFFNIYRTIALITHLLFYLFLALCIVDILDRIDPVKFNRTVFLQSISFQNSAIALIFYTIAMIINLVMMQTEDYLRMTQYAKNVTNTTILSVKDIVGDTTDRWKQFTAVRAAFIIAGWFIVSMHVKKDRLSTMIKNTEEKAFYEELNIEQNTIPPVSGMNLA